VCALASSLLSSSTGYSLTDDPELSLVLSYPVQQAFDRCHSILRRLFSYLAVRTEEPNPASTRRLASYSDESDVSDTAGVTPERFVRFAGECSLVPKLLTEEQLQACLEATPPLLVSRAGSNESTNESVDHPHTIWGARARERERRAGRYARGGQQETSESPAFVATVYTYPQLVEIIGRCALQLGMKAR
jgi:hypothetical protein